jgi:hypothetical protein
VPALGQATPDNEACVEPVGFGLVTIDQLVPFQRSMRLVKTFVAD